MENQQYNFLDLRPLSELADYAHTTPDYLRYLIFKKKLQGQKIGNIWFSKKEWVDVYRASSPVDLARIQQTRVGSESAEDARERKNFQSLGEKSADVLWQSRPEGIITLREKDVVELKAHLSSLPYVPASTISFAALTRSLAVAACIMLVSAGAVRLSASPTLIVTADAILERAGFADSWLDEKITDTVMDARDRIAFAAVAIPSPLTRLMDFVRSLFGEETMIVRETAPSPPTPVSPVITYRVPDVPTPLLTGRRPATPQSPAVSAVTHVREVIERRETIIPADLAVVKSEILVSVNELNAAIREYVQRQISGLSSTVSYASSQAGSSIQMVTISQDIDTLISPTIQKGMTIASGGLAITDGNIDITSGNITADDISARGDLSATGDFLIGGGGLSFTAIATTTIPDLTINAYSIATSSAPVPFLTFDTLNYRIGIGTTSPGTTFAVNGNVLISDGLTIGNTLTTQGASATTSFLGKTVFSYVPTLPHEFSAWAIGAAGSSVLNAPLVINPGSAAADTNLIGLAVANSPRFLVDAEGDIFANSITTTGGSVLATTTASNFAVENNFTSGDAVGDVLTINAGSIRYENTATSSIKNDTLNAWSIIASTTNTSILSIDTTVMGGRIGVGTTSPWGYFSIEQTGLDPIFVVSDQGTSSPHFWIDGTGNVGIGTTSPGTLFSVQGVGNFVSAATSTLYTDLSLRSLSATSTLYLADGAVSVPALSFAADTNTGIFRAGADLLAFVTGGSERIRIDNNGNVGICTPSPRTILDMKGDLTISGNDINLGTGTATTTISGGFGIGVGTTTPGAAFAVATSTAGANTAFLLSNLGSGYTLWAEDSARYDSVCD